MTQQRDEDAQRRIHRVAVEDAPPTGSHPPPERVPLPFERMPLHSARRANGNRSRARPDVYVTSARRWRG
jgi:hypothetical protein